MKYMGSKRRIAKDIYPIILKDRKEGQYYVEPFCGGCNSLDKVANPRIGSDINPYLIALLKELQTQVPFNPPYFTEDCYKPMRDNKELYPAWQIGYVGFNLTYGARFFEGWARASGRDYQAESIRHLQRQQQDIIGVNFMCGFYSDFLYPPQSIIYCDPPYKGTKEYKDKKLDYEKFYNWCREMVEQGHTVFVSEYNMPNDFECVWKKEITSSLTKDTGAKKGVEKLFKLSKKEETNAK